MPEIERQQQMGKEVVFRADSAFAKPEVYEALEERGVKYAIRIPANDAVDQGGEAGGEDNAAQLPPVPIERGAAVAECDRLEPEQPLAAAGAAAEDWQLVADQAAAVASEDRRTAHQARAVLLASVGGESSDSTVVWSHAGQGRGAALASGVGEPPTGSDFKRRADRGRKGARKIGRKRGRFGLWHSREGQKWPLPPVLEAPNSENSTGPCLEKRLGVRYQ